MVGATRVGHATVVSLLQPSAKSTMSSNGRSAMRFSYVGVVQHIEGRRVVGSAWQGLQLSDGEVGRRLGFQYLRIKIHHKTGNIYRAFYTES
jgi:hypothetical protein